MRIKRWVSIGVSYAPILALTSGAYGALARARIRPLDFVTPGGDRFSAPNFDKALGRVLDVALCDLGVTKATGATTY